MEDTGSTSARHLQTVRAQPPRRWNSTPVAYRASEALSDGELGKGGEGEWEWKSRRNDTQELGPLPASWDSRYSEPERKWVEGG